MTLCVSYSAAYFCVMSKKHLIQNNAQQGITLPSSHVCTIPNKSKMKGQTTIKCNIPAPFSIPKIWSNKVCYTSFVCSYLPKLR